jgi:ribosome-associated protein
MTKAARPLNRHIALATHGPTAQTRDGVLQALRACDAKKASDIVLLELDKDSGAFTDYFVICSGSNPRQIQAISDEVDLRLKTNGYRPTHVEGYNQAEWILLDYVDFVVHIFSETARKFYDLERLWKSARRVSATDLSKPSPAKRPRKTVAGKASRSSRALSKAGPPSRGRAAARRGKKKPRR